MQACCTILHDWCAHAILSHCDCATVGTSACLRKQESHVREQDMRHWPSGSRVRVQSRRKLGRFAHMAFDSCKARGMADTMRDCTQD